MKTADLLENRHISSTDDLDYLVEAANWPSNTDSITLCYFRFIWILLKFIETLQTFRKFIETYRKYLNFIEWIVKFKEFDEFNELKIGSGLWNNFMNCYLHNKERKIWNCRSSGSCLSRKPDIFNSFSEFYTLFTT